MWCMRRFVIFWLLIIANVCFTAVYAQKPRVATTIKGVITDAQTNEAVPYATVSFEGLAVGTRSDMDGKFTLSSYEASDKIKVSSVGYLNVTLKIDKGKYQTIAIKLKQDTKNLDEVVVKPKKQRYKKRDNPAIELIENVIAHRDENRKEDLESYEYEKYEKLQFALSNVTDEFRQKKAFRKFQFIFENLDSTKLSGKKILPVYMKEDISDCYYRKQPKDEKEIVKAHKMVGFEGYIDNQSLDQFLKYLYQDIDIYDNNVLVLTNQFLSPIASTATAFYKYFIVDTICIGEATCVKMFFSPYNKTDFLFQGYLYVFPDSNFVVNKVDMYVNKNINLNWVKDLSVKQEFNKVQGRGWMLTDDQIAMDFGVSQTGSGIYGQRNVSYRKYMLNKPMPDSVFDGPKIETLRESEKRSDAYWEENRHTPLDNSEKGVYAIIDSVKNIPAFKRTMTIFMLVLTGYKDFGYFEIGPMNAFYSYNPIEGFRLRFGGRTTPKLSKKYMFETYSAYGFRDEQWKYYIGTSYSFTDKSIWEFPVKSLRVSYQKETKIPGQELQFIQEDNVLLSIKRGENDKLFYNNTARIDYLNEFDNHFSIGAGYSFMRQSPAGSLYFNYTDYSLKKNDVSNIDISEVNITLRYAPNEQYMQGKQFRIPLASKYPVFQLQYTLGSKLLANDYDYHKLTFSISRRFFFSVFGYTDVEWEASKIFGKVPYPLLSIHRANQTYSYQIMSYNLMNFLEFVSDQYTSLNIDHCFNGFIFNKIPLFKKLKFREVMACKVLYGNVSDQNNPKYHTDLFRFPVEDDGTPTTYTLEKEPYAEASVGISNILKMFRVDLVRRLTYLDNQNVAKLGIRVRFKLDF